MGKELKRMNYFNGLLLDAEDYNQDKEYQRRLQGLHNRYLHTWGIISGLEVKPVSDSNMEVYVTEGAALDFTSEGLDGSEIEESISRQIIMYEGHPENPIDLSEYNAGENIYIFLGYLESNADWDSEKGQGQEIHIWECGKLHFSTVKPQDIKKNILLARVVPRIVYDENTKVSETVIDSICIYDTDTDGTPLRVYAGAYGCELMLDKFTFDMGKDIKKTPSIEVSNNDLEFISNQELPVEGQEASKYTFVKFKGDVSIVNDLGYTGKLISKKKDGEIKTEFKFNENFLQLNSKDKDDVETWYGTKDAGMDVYRGGNGVPDARIAWSEAEQKWKAGLENNLSPIVYGQKYESLRSNEPIDQLHLHNILYSKKGKALSVDKENDLSVNGDLIINDNDIEFKSQDGSGQVAWYGGDKLFGNAIVDGSVLLGKSGGLLATTYEGKKAVLSWNKNGNRGKVGIGSVNLSNSDDDMDVAGSSRILIGSNPLRVTSQWTAFPDKTINQAEICNDTTYHKALMIVGNQSAGQGRKVAIWDWLDVNGFLYINGNMQILKKLSLSEGQGNNGIIFPSDPGGGSGDSSWIKYYPKILENGKKVKSCILEIGTSNDSNDNILINPSGNVGISRFTLNEKLEVQRFTPNEKLDVEGYTRIMSGTNPIRFTSSWSGFTSKSPMYAEICNDTGIYKSLMIAGNRSGGYERRVSMWDDVDINGELTVQTNIRIDGAIIPGVGECEVNGIMFDMDKDNEKDTGNAAWIRYYSDRLRGGGENMTLEIGISNDSNITTETGKYWESHCPYSWVTNPCGVWRYYTRTVIGNGGDRLRLYASGGTYVDGNFYITSSKEYKENINELSKTTARKAIEDLEPVEYSFKGDYKRTTLGFVAENVPDSLASYNKKAISPMEIMTVLVSEVKDQERALGELKKKINKIKRRKKYN